MKKYWIDFSGWGSVYAESKEEAEDKFWQWVNSLFSNDCDFILAELDKKGVEED